MQGSLRTTGRDSQLGSPVTVKTTPVDFATITPTVADKDQQLQNIIVGVDDEESNLAGDDTLLIEEESFTARVTPSLGSGYSGDELESKVKLDLDPDVSLASIPTNSDNTIDWAKLFKNLDQLDNEGMSVVLEMLRALLVKTHKNQRLINTKVNDMRVMVGKDGISKTVQEKLQQESVCRTTW